MYRRFMIAWCFGIGASAAAADYTVQIGAMSEPDPAFTQAASAHGEVIAKRLPSGVTLFQVGRFQLRNDATALRNKLIEAGYADAYVKTTTVARSVEQSAPESTQPAQLASLSPEEREKVVFLDGVLHIKDGDTFTPVDSLPASRRSNHD